MTSVASSVRIALFWKGPYSSGDSEFLSLEFCWKGSKDRVIAPIDQRYSPTSSQPLTIELTNLKDASKTSAYRLSLLAILVKTLKITAHFNRTIKLYAEQEDRRLILVSEKIKDTMPVSWVSMSNLKGETYLSLSVIHEKGTLKAEMAKNGMVILSRKFFRTKAELLEYLKQPKTENDSKTASLSEASSSS